jgi:hypothetical protein
MSSGGGSSGSTTTTTELPSWAQPYAQQLLTQGSALSQQAVPQYTGQTVAGQNSTQTGATAAATGATANAGNLANTADSTAANYANASGPSISNPYTGNVTASTAATPYASVSNNPYLSQEMGATNQAITNSYNSSTAPTTLAQFRNAGAFGGSAQAQATSNNEYQLGNALTNADTAIGNNAYNTAAGVASQDASQQNAVNLSNQAIGTNANNAYNQNVSSNYYNNGALANSSMNTALGANEGYGTLANNQMGMGTSAQTTSQDQLNALYQQWYNQANAPYQQESTLSSALSGALGSGAGTTVGTSQAGTGNTLASLLGIGATGAGLYGSLSS